MKLHDLMLAHEWPEVWATNIFVRDYGESEAVSKLYSNVYRYLRQTTPKPSDDVITIQQIVDLETGIPLGQCDVGGIIHDSELGEPELCSLEATNWDEWLGMEVKNETGRYLTGPELLAHCLFEMTFLGWFPGDGKASLDEDYRALARMMRPKKRKYDALICHARH